MCRDKSFGKAGSDIDGNITSVGIDLDLDHSIDHEFSNNASWSDFSFHQTPAFAFSNGTMASRGNGEWAHIPNTCFVKFNLIAIDDDANTAFISEPSSGESFDNTSPTLTNCTVSGNTSGGG